MEAQLRPDSGPARSAVGEWAEVNPGLNWVGGWVPQTLLGYLAQCAGKRVSLV